MFSGWYLEPGCINEWNGTKPTSGEEEIKIYAKWQMEEK